MKAKKALAKKKPSRRSNFVYWNADQFARLQTAPAAKLASKGNLSWRWLGFLLDANPAVEPIRDVIRRRADGPDDDRGGAEAADEDARDAARHGRGDARPAAAGELETGGVARRRGRFSGRTGGRLGRGRRPRPPAFGDLVGRLKMGGVEATAPAAKQLAKTAPPSLEPYDPVTATPTLRLKDMMVFRAVQPAVRPVPDGLPRPGRGARADPDPGEPAGDAGVGGEDGPGAVAGRPAAGAVVAGGDRPGRADGGHPDAGGHVPAGRPERRAVRGAEVPGPAGPEDAAAVRAPHRPRRRPVRHARLGRRRPAVDRQHVRHVRPRPRADQAGGRPVQAPCCG